MGDLKSHSTAASPLTSSKRLKADSPPQTILVTGGAGFIGSHFVRLALGKPHTRVVNVDALTYAGNLDNLADVADHANYRFIRADICDGELLGKLFAEECPTAVVHLAAESHVDKSIAAPDDFIRTNVVGTTQLLKCSLSHWEHLNDSARESFRFLHVSTDEVFGSLRPTGKFSEASPYHPSSPYSASKAAADHLTRAFFVTYGLPTIISNCSNNYGPNQLPEKLVPLMTLQALAGKMLPLFGDGQNVRDWLHVEDHCAALWQILTLGTPGEDYCVGGNCEKRNLEVVHAICTAINELRPELAHRPWGALVEFVADRPGHDRRYAVDTTKITRELGWRPQVAFESGLRSTVAWYLDNSNWVERVLSGVYRRE